MKLSIYLTNTSLICRFILINGITDLSTQKRKVVSIKSDFVKKKEKKKLINYLGRIDFLEVLDNIDNSIGDLGFVKKGASNFLGETAADGIEGETEEAVVVRVSSSR